VEGMCIILKVIMSEIW